MLSSTARSSRPSFIDGNFEIVKYAEFLSKEYARALAQAIKEVTKEETTELQKKAKDSSTAWSTLSNNVDAKYNEETGNFEYGIKGNSEQARMATDLEYGVPSKVAPQPLLRSHVLSNQNGVGNKIAEKVHVKLKAKYR